MNNIKLNRFRYVTIICFVMAALFVCIGCSSDADTDVPYPHNTDTDGEKVWKGDYEIKDSNDVKKISDYIRITGDLNIEDSNLTNLAGLENLTSVGGMLWIYGNQALTSLEGLKNLTSVGDLDISLNAKLTNLAGLENLTKIDDGGLYISGNDSLISLDINKLCLLKNDWFAITSNVELCTHLAEDLKDQIEECSDSNIDGPEIHQNKSCQ